jgi:hypothetical protein
MEPAEQGSRPPRRRHFFHGHDPLDEVSTLAEQVEVRLHVAEQERLRREAETAPVALVDPSFDGDFNVARAAFAPDATEWESLKQAFSALLDTGAVPPPQVAWDWQAYRRFVWQVRDPFGPAVRLGGLETSDLVVDRSYARPSLSVLVGEGWVRWGKEADSPWYRDEDSSLAIMIDAMVRRAGKGEEVDAVMAYRRQRRLPVVPVEQRSRLQRLLRRR